MGEALLPLFPLRVVLLPGAPLPLHIFEERYKEMLGEALETHSEFGVVLQEEKGILNIGCTATVEKVLQRYPDGRMDLIAVGRRRFEILLLNEEKSYLRGEVQFFDDEADDPATPALRQAAFEGYQAMQTVAATPGDAPELNHPQLSFQLARALPELEFRQQLLSSRSEADRIRRLAEFFPVSLARQRHIQHVLRVAPGNGHA